MTNSPRRTAFVRFLGCTIGAVLTANVAYAACDTMGQTAASHDARALDRLFDEELARASWLGCDPRGGFAATSDPVCLEQFAVLEDIAYEIDRASSQPSNGGCEMEFGPRGEELMVSLPDGAGVPVPTARPVMAAEVATGAQDVTARHISPPAANPVSAEEYANLTVPREIPADRLAVRVVGPKFLPDQNERIDLHASADAVQPAANRFFNSMLGMIGPSQANAAADETPAVVTSLAE